MHNGIKVQGWLVDDFGYIIDSIVVDKNKDILNNEVIEPFPMQPILFKPKWDGVEWVEGATQEEIDEMTKVEPLPPTEMDLLKEQVLAQQIIIDELLFEVIPSLLPKEEGMI